MFSGSIFDWYEYSGFPLYLMNKTQFSKQSTLGVINNVTVSSIQLCSQHFAFPLQIQIFEDNWVLIYYWKWENIQVSRALQRYKGLPKWICWQGQIRGVAKQLHALSSCVMPGLALAAVVPKAVALLAGTAVMVIFFHHTPWGSTGAAFPVISLPPALGTLLGQTFILKFGWWPTLIFPVS